MTRTALVLLSATLAVALPRTGRAQILAGSLSGLKFGDSVSETTVRLAEPCEDVELHGPGPPRLPTSRASETHVVCRGWAAISHGTDAALTFSDDALVLIELRGGGAARSLAGRAPGEPVGLGPLRGWPGPGLVVDAEADVAWLMAPSALHPQAWLWTSPHLGGVPDARVASAARPAELVFGASVEDVRDRLAPRCRWMQEKAIEPPELPGEVETQTQVDCFGLSYAGGPRKVEAVFADGRLALAWILTGEAEEERIRAALIEAYGAPRLVHEEAEVFEDGVVLRKDKPEVLFLSGAMAPAFVAWLTGPRE